MRRFDEWLIDSVFQKIADWFCLHIGWDCFMLGRGCRVVFAIGLFCEACWLDPFWFTRFLNFAVGTVWLFLAFWQPDPPFLAGVRNITRTLTIAFVNRTFMLTFAIANIPVDIALSTMTGKFGWIGMNLAWFCFAFSDYFRACDPTPPPQPQRESVPELVLEPAS